MVFLGGNRPQDRGAITATSARGPFRGRWRRRRPPRSPRRPRQSLPTRLSMRPQAPGLAPLRPGPCGGLDLETRETTVSLPKSALPLAVAKERFVEPDRVCPSHVVDCPPNVVAADRLVGLSSVGVPILTGQVDPPRAQ